MRFRYLYHVTVYDRLSSIARSGLEPGSRSVIGRGGFAGHSAGRTFLTEFDGVSFWYERAKLHIEDMVDDPHEDEQVPVVLRIPTKRLPDLEVDKSGTRDAGSNEAFFTTEDIPAKHIDVWSGSRWIKVSQWRQIDIEDAFEADTFDDGDGEGEQTWWSIKFDSPLEPQNESITKPQATLVEAEEDWLYHGAPCQYLDMIAKTGKLIPGRHRKTRRFVSFSELMDVADQSRFGANGAILVFRKSAMRDRLLDVEYSRNWAKQYPKHARYIADVRGPFDVWRFLDMRVEREWVGKRAGAIPFDKGELVAVLVNTDHCDLRDAREWFAPYLSKYYVIDKRAGMRMIRMLSKVRPEQPIPTRAQMQTMEPTTRLGRAHLMKGKLKHLAASCILDGIDGQQLDERSAKPPSQFVKGGYVTLYHYAHRDHGDTYEVDPKMSVAHRRGYSRREYQVSKQPRTFWYLDPHDREPMVGPHLYSVKWNATMIYNLLADPLGLKDQARNAYGRIDFDMLFKLVRAKGYDGVYYKPGFHVVNLFGPAVATKVQTPQRLAASVQDAPGWILDERRGEWFFHVTKFKHLRAILRERRITGNAYASFSKHPVLPFTPHGGGISGKDVVLVFKVNGNTIAQLEEVEYTESWVEGNLDQAAYIAGFGNLEGFHETSMFRFEVSNIARQYAFEHDIEAGSDDWYDLLEDDEIREYAAVSLLSAIVKEQQGEREWISEDTYEAAFKFSRADLDRILVVRPSRLAEVKRLVDGLYPAAEVMLLKRRRGTYPRRSAQKRKLAASVDRPQATLVERAMDEIYHTTKLANIEQILSDKKLRGRPFISLSSDPQMKFGDFVFVLRRPRLESQLIEVEYTREWAEKHPKRTRYVVGGGGAGSAGSWKFVVQDFLDPLGNAAFQREHEVQSKGRDIKLVPGSIKKLLIHKDQARMLEGLRRIVAENGLMDPNDVVVMRGSGTRQREQKKRRKLAKRRMWQAKHDVEPETISVSMPQQMYYALRKEVDKHRDLTTGTKLAFRYGAPTTGDYTAHFDVPTDEMQTLVKLVRFELDVARSVYTDEYSKLPDAVTVKQMEAWLKKYGFLGESLVERRGEWLFHTTDVRSALKILKQHKLLGYNYVSFSDTATWVGTVTFVFHRSKMRDRTMKVDYTVDWARKHPEHAKYIAGTDLVDEDEITGFFLFRQREREWVSVEEDVTLKPGDIDRIIVKPDSGGISGMPKLAQAVAQSPLVRDEDLMWRDVPKLARYRLPKSLKLSKSKQKQMAAWLSGKPLKGTMGSGVPAG